MSKYKDNYDISLLLNGNGLLDNYINNSNYFYNQYRTSSKDILSIKMEQMHTGYFYFLFCKDSDKRDYFMYSPIFVVDFRKVGNLIVIFAVNFNLIPLDMRPFIIDNLVNNNIMETDSRVDINYEYAYKILMKYGFEYAIVEYNPFDVVKVFKISTNILGRFTCSGYPSVKYDHRKLYSIWKNALKTRDKRYDEMRYKLVSELELVKRTMNENYNKLR